MIIRRLKPSEAEQAVRMSEFAFQYELTDTERRMRMADMNPSDTWVAEEKDDLLSKLTILPLQIFLHGTPVSAGGVSGVATWPEYRRKGLVTLLLHHALEDMRNSGKILSLLYPFSISFYRHFGWELFADQEVINMERHQFPKRESHEGVCRRLTENKEIIASVYRQWAEKYNGPLLRGSDWWDKSVFKRKKGDVIAYYRDDKVRGYMIYDIKNRHMNIEELIWLDPDARKGLFSFIANHDSMAENISLKLPAHEMTPHLLPDPKVKREVSSYFMARIVDCTALLEQYPFQLQKNENIILHISDHFCTWNERTYIISKDKEKANRIRSYSRQRQEDKDFPKLLHEGLHMSINTLSALLFGTYTARRLWEEGLISGPEDSAALLSRAVPSGSPAFYDFF